MPSTPTCSTALPSQSKLRPASQSRCRLLCQGRQVPSRVAGAVRLRSGRRLSSPGGIRRAGYRLRPRLARAAPRPAVRLELGGSAPREASGTPLASPPVRASAKPKRERPGSNCCGTAPPDHLLHMFHIGAPASPRHNRLLAVSVSTGGRLDQASSFCLGRPSASRPLRPRGHRSVPQGRRLSGRLDQDSRPRTFMESRPHLLWMGWTSLSRFPVTCSRFPRVKRRSWRRSFACSRPDSSLMRCASSRSSARVELGLRALARPLT